MKYVVALVMALALMMPTAANAAEHKHYGEHAAPVAREIGCMTQWKVRRAPFSNSSVECMLPNSKFAYVITFDTKAKQAKWEALVAKTEGRRFFYTSGKGAVLITDNGSRAVANKGAEWLPGKVKHG